MADLCIGDERTHIALHCVTPGSDFSTVEIGIKSARLSAHIYTDEFPGREQVARELQRLYDDAPSEATICSADGFFVMEMKRHQLGRIEISVKAKQYSPNEIEASLRFLIDQSYLPAIISGLGNFYLAAS